jgi:hypothetical protein
MTMWRSSPSRGSLEVLADALLRNVGFMCSRFLIFLARRAALSIVYGSILAQASAQLIPPDRVVDWTPGIVVGVPGGIPIRITQIDATASPYSADKTGNSDAAAAINSAISAAPSNSVVLLPAGTYKLLSPIRLKNFVSIRGEGADKTFLRYSATWGAAITIGAGTDYQWNSPGAPDNAIVGGMSKGSSNIVVGSASQVSVGDLLHIRTLNNPALPVIHTMGYERVQRQFTRVVAKSGNSLTIWPPLYWSLDPALAPTFARGQKTEYAGVENLAINAIDSTSPTAMVNFEQAFACWALNVRVNDVANYGIGGGTSLQCEIRGCRITKAKTGGSNHAGILLGISSGFLVEDNICEYVFPNVELNGVSGCVFAYNFFDSDYWGGSFNANHNPHNHRNLYEGNMSANFQSDGYFGGASDETLFRNWWHTEVPYSGTQNQVQSTIWAVKLNRFCRNFSLVGNLIGTPKTNLTYYGLLSIGKPNIGNEDWLGFGPPWSQGLREGGQVMFSQNGSTVTASSPFFGATNVGCWIQSRTDGSVSQVGSYISATQVSVNTSANRTNQTFALAAGPAGFQELDTNVLATALFKANFYFPTAKPQDSRVWPTNQSQNSVSIGAEVLPQSLFRSTKPSYFGKLAWPPFDPANPTPGTTPIPAAYRFLYGTNPPAASSSEAPQAPSNLKILQN